MTNAFIYDAVRTPRSKGKEGSALHEVKPIELGASLLRELRSRHDFDTAYVEDVMMGCTAAVGEQSAGVAKTIAMQAGWSDTIPGVQMDGFCASGLDTVSTAAQKVLSGWYDQIAADGVESMSLIPMGTAGGSLLFDPEVVMDHTSMP